MGRRFSDGIIDLTSKLGTEKCLLILGITGEAAQEKLKESNGCLGHKDVEVLGIEIMKSTKGEKVELVKGENWRKSRSTTTNNFR